MYSCVLLRFGNALTLTHGLEVPLPPSGETHSHWKLPYKFYGFFFLCVLKETGRECTPFVAKLNPFVCKFSLNVFGGDINLVLDNNFPQFRYHYYYYCVLNLEQ